MTFLVTLEFTTTYFFKLPTELVEYIRCYYYNKSATIIQFWARYIFRKKIQELTKLNTFAWTRCKFPQNNYSIFYKNKILNKEDIFKTFVTCKCCKRHQINKPTSFKLWYDTEFNYTQETNCNCACRHISRFLCREIDN